MWLGDNETMQGLAADGTDGNLYQWVQGVDGLGNAVGCWKCVSRQAPQAAYTRNATPFLGEVAEGADGNLYQWVQGVDGLGNAFGFWKKLKKLAKRAMPLARMAASFVPGASAALTVATPFLKKVGVAGADGLGALYAAPDGSMYQVQGVDAGDDLNGIDADDLNGIEAGDELNGFAADADLNGIAAGEDLNGLAADEMNGVGADDDLRGFAAGDELNGFAAGDELNGVDDAETMNGYVRDRGVNGVDAFVPDRPRQTPAFSPSPSAPMWAPLW
jgi:hypothetical protein